MRKWLIPVIVIVAIAAIIGFWAVGIKNGAVAKNQNVSKTWGDVQTAYQRRNDLIGNLVNTVKGAADFEKSTLTAVVEARAKATSVNVNADNLTPEKLEEFNKAQSGVSSSLSRLLVSVEAYPQLKANENFLKLQDELASTENMIQTSRVRYNESVVDYNSYILTFPNSMFLGKYKEKAYFNAVEGAEKPVEVKF
ncbi:LemA family protein [Flavobacterium kingsejongi]|uniref:LemA family protein n=1 Tax=Flavobacterium kingsejongi TaxID=1678728 RepID=A0A2S1LJA5_9FLAO|nr:LemA family protein [Flavobacterium kingsejongi]AWG23798.1 LemA family protein [Flavobacterium kingsejongi]